MGGGAFYSQTPKSCLEDLGVNKGVNEVPDQSYSSEARVSSQLENETEINKKLDSRTQGFENDKVSHSEAKAEESQSRMQRIVCALTPTHSRMVFKPAFTLAEVLITLGIVGIIAAMTLPMLAENYQRRIVETRLKRFYTTFNQAILRAVDYHGPTDAWDYRVHTSSSNYNFEDIPIKFNYYLRPYLNIILEQKVIYVDGTEAWLYYFSDGSAFMFLNHSNSDILFYPHRAAICLKKSARERKGSCEFNFLFAQNNYLQDKNTRYHKDKYLEPYMWSWDGKYESLYTADGLGCNNTGQFCTRIIQLNGWHIPKNYPKKICY